MIALEGKLNRLRMHAREWAKDFAPHSLAVDRDPNLIKNLGDLPVYARMATLQIPPNYNPNPLTLDGRRYYLVSAVEQVVHVEECASVDLGMTLGAPGAPMGGILVSILGDEKQQEWFYGRLLEQTTWTFFALTEPEGGSDAAALRTAAQVGPDSVIINGAKKFVTNSARGDIGVIFARTGRGPLSISAIMVELPTPGFRAVPIPTLGLRAAQLGAIALNSLEVGHERVLGRHLPPSRRGMLGWLHTLNRLRPVAAAMGVGVARAAYEYVVAGRKSVNKSERERLERMRQRIETVRQLVLYAAIHVDRDPANGHVASAAKVMAARLAEAETVEALTFFGPGARLDHPMLDKYVRDARGLEYMEGTSNIQKLGLFGQLARAGMG